VEHQISVSFEKFDVVQARVVYNILIYRDSFLILNQSSEHSPHLFPMFNLKKHRLMHCDVSCYATNYTEHLRF
jgi:hypothetical protein